MNEEEEFKRFRAHRDHRSVSGRRLEYPYIYPYGKNDEEEADDDDT